MPIQRSQLTKLAHTPTIPPHTDDDTFLVGVYMHDEDAPAPDTLMEVEHPDRYPHPNHRYGRVKVTDMKKLNDDEGVRILIFARKEGPIVFTEEQIWAAYKQYVREFHYRSEQPYHTETMEEFKARDIIGYEETMGGFERILYKAIDYI